MSDRTQIPAPFLGLANLLLLIPLALHGYFGSFSRYLADDFCTAGLFNSRGFIPSLQYWYTGWSGRYSFYFFINLAHWIGWWITPYLAALAVLAWVVVLYALTRRFLRLLHASQPALLALLLAGIVCFATLDGAPDIYQSFYWQTGLVTYVVPLLLFTGYASWFLGCIERKPTGRVRWGTLALSAGLTWFAGGFSETYAAVQAAALVVFLLATVSLAKAESRRVGAAILAAGLAGALVALVMILAAPGNAVRMNLMPERLDLPALAFLSLRYSLTFAAKALLNAPTSFLAAILAPGLLAVTFSASNANFPAARPSRTSLYLTGIPAVIYFFIVASVAPAVYATAAYPAERALITAQFILIAGVAAWSLLAGLHLRPFAGCLASRPALIGTIVLLLLLAGTAVSSQKTLNRLPDGQTYAQLWDARDREIRQQAAAGVRDVSAASLPHMSPGLAELSEDPGNWINQCLAISYGLRSVKAK
jgi:hypothetical protein